MAKFQLNPGVKNPLQNQQTQRVRIGSVSVFALVVIICLAVLAVLAFSTANASLTLTQRQAVATTELYLDETAAQEFLGGMDSILASVRTADATSQADSQIEFERNEWGNVAYDKNGLVVVVETEAGNGSGSAAGADAPAAGKSTASAAADAKQGAQTAGAAGAAAVAQALPDLCASAREITNGQVTATAQAFDNRIKAEFSCENGRTLNIVVTIRNNGTYRIDRWKMSAVQNEEPPQGQFWISD